MESRLYLLEELPVTYGKLQGFCTDLFLGEQIRKASELKMFKEAQMYMVLRQAYRRSQRNKAPWPAKVAQFNMDLALTISRAKQMSEEATLLVDYKKKIEDGSHEIRENEGIGPGPYMGPKESEDNSSLSTCNNWADSEAQLSGEDPLCSS
uniref:V3 n=1 Tax=Capulavirus medicagonis TaxID=1306546 RepID=A0A3S7GQL6_9GEMI|nr:V3 [Alfalfa leaf curl virus]